MNVVDKAGAPHAFDSLKVYYYDDNVSLITDYKSPEFNSCREKGSYPIVNDNMKGVFFFNKSNTKLSENISPYVVRVVGYNGERTTLNWNFRIESDGCHVSSVRDFDSDPVVVE